MVTGSNHRYTNQCHTVTTTSGQSLALISQPCPANLWPCSPAMFCYSLIPLHSHALLFPGSAPLLCPATPWLGSPALSCYSLARLPGRVLPLPGSAPLLCPATPWLDSPALSGHSLSGDDAVALGAPAAAAPERAPGVSAAGLPLQSPGAAPRAMPLQDLRHAGRVLVLLLLLRPHWSKQTQPRSQESPNTDRVLSLLLRPHCDTQTQTGHRGHLTGDYSSSAPTGVHRPTPVRGVTKH